MLVGSCRAPLCRVLRWRRLPRAPTHLPGAATGAAPKNPLRVTSFTIADARARAVGSLADGAANPSRPGFAGPVRCVRWWRRERTHRVSRGILEEEAIERNVQENFMSDNRQPPAYGAYRDPNDPAPEASTVGSPYTPGTPQASHDPYASAPAPVTDGPRYSQDGYPRKLPGRGLPITLIVLGAIVAFIVAPIVGLGSTAASMFSGMDVDKITQQAESKTPGQNPTKVDVQGSAVIVAVLTDSQEFSATCEAKGADGKSLELAGQQAQKSAKSYTFMAQEAGSYQVGCVLADGQPAKSMVVMPMDLAGAAKAGLIGGGIAFVIGLAMLIGGIVLLVKRNRARREILASSGSY